MPDVWKTFNRDSWFVLFDIVVFLLVDLAIISYFGGNFDFTFSCPLSWCFVVLYI